MTAGIVSLVKNEFWKEFCEHAYREYSGNNWCVSNMGGTVTRSGIVSKEIAGYLARTLADEHREDFEVRPEGDEGDFRFGRFGVFSPNEEDDRCEQCGGYFEHGSLTAEYVNDKFWDLCGDCAEDV